MKKLTVIITTVMLSGLIMGFPAHAGKVDDTKMRAMGTKNGCSDGYRDAAQKNKNAYNSIMNNRSINAVYKDAYRKAWSECYQKGIRGKKINGDISDKAKCFNSQGCPRKSNTGGIE